MLYMLGSKFFRRWGCERKYFRRHVRKKWDTVTIFDQQIGFAVYLS